MLSYFEFAIQQYDEYQGSGALMIVFWLAVLALWITNHYKTNETIKHIISYTAVVMIIAVFPPTVKIIAEYCIGTDVYWRMFWLLPEVIVIAYILTQLVCKAEGIKRAVSVVLVCAIVALSCTSFLEYVQIDEDKGTLKLSNTVVTICDYLHTAAENYEDEEIRCIFPNEMLESVRQYDATIKMPYGREEKRSATKHVIYDIMQATTLDADALVYYANAYDCNYLVYPASTDGQVEADLIAAGYEQLTLIDGYYVYHLSGSWIANSWQVTSYSDESGNQAMCYLLYNQREDLLIVIDGGWSDNTDQVRSLINQYGGKVDVWIITHYHKDHVSAFNEIYSDPQGITIEQVYAPEYDYDYFAEHAQTWDDFGSYETFLEVTKDADNLTYVHRDDQIFVGSLEIDILNAYDTLCEETSSDIGNDGGLVMKVIGKYHTMLFCCDVHSAEMADMLIERYGDSLQADYVQLGHHGNNSFPTYFYEVVNASVAVFDAPEWLMTSEDYTAKDLKEWFVENGVETVDFTTAPNNLYL